MSPADALRDIVSSLPGGEGKEMSRDIENIQRMRDSATTGGKRPEDMSPQELHSILWQILTFRDSVVKKIEKTIGEFTDICYSERLIIAMNRENSWTWSIDREVNRCNFWYVTSFSIWQIDLDDICLVFVLTTLEVSSKNFCFCIESRAFVSLS